MAKVTKGESERISFKMPFVYMQALNDLQKNTGIKSKAVFYRLIFENFINKNDSEFFKTHDKHEINKGFGTLEKLQIKQFIQEIERQIKND